MTILIKNARVLTLAGEPAARRGASVGELQVIERGWVRLANTLIDGVGRGEAPASARADQHIDAAGRVLMPAFTDCHTHLCWAGDRLDEWEARLAGASYLEILEGGGGILSTVRAVRAASEASLASHLESRLAVMLHEGTTAVEIKSGYGLTTRDELKMLRAIARAADTWAGLVSPTACIGHAVDPEADRETFIQTTIEETLPGVSAEFPGVTIDAYCERGAWTLDEALRLFEKALGAGHPVRVHADQFTSLGMIPEAVRRGFRSVDHLEATTAADLQHLASSDTFGVMLPCSGFHLDQRYADGRRFLDAGGRLAIATNANPGSAPCQSMPMAIALAARHNGLTPAEAIACATATPAALLGLEGSGSIAPGARADLILLRFIDERSLAFEFGGDPVDAVFCAGRPVRLRR